MIGGILWRFIDWWMIPVTNSTNFDIVAIKSFHDTYISHADDSFNWSYTVACTESWIVHTKGSKLAFTNPSGYQLCIKDDDAALEQTDQLYFWDVASVPDEPTKISIVSNGKYLSFHPDGTTTIKDWLKEWEWFEIQHLSHFPQVNNKISFKTSYGEYLTFRKGKIVQTSIESDAKWTVKSEIPGQLGFAFAPLTYLAVHDTILTVASELLEMEHFCLIIQGEKFQIKSHIQTYLSAYEDGSIILTEDPDEHALFLITFY